VTRRVGPPGDYSGGPKTGQPPSRLSLATITVRWLWRLDAAANWATTVTGRRCAADINRELRRQRKGQQ
jgi:hypothetical protein